MLPEIISNDLCSLNPQEDKRAFSAIFELDTNAKVVSQRFTKTLINSNKRFTYQTAQDVLDKKIGDYKNELSILKSLAEKLHKQRVKDGAIEFETDETKTLVFVISASSLVAASLGIATEAKIPMMTITKTNSIIVNADLCFLFFILYILYF